MTELTPRRVWTEHRGAVLAVVGLVAVVAVVLGCWWALRPDPEPPAPSRQAMLTGTPVQVAIERAGGHCVAAGATDRRNCELAGVDFQLVPGAWTAQAGERERQCNQDQVSPQVQLLTNHSWVIYADESEQLERVAVALRGQGAPAQKMGYCDHD